MFSNTRSIPDPKLKKTLPVRPWPAAAKPAVGKSAAAKADYIRPMQTMAHKGPLISAVLPATPIYCVPMKPYLPTLHFLYFHIWYFILFFLFLYCVSLKHSPVSWGTWLLKTIPWPVHLLYFYIRYFISFYFLNVSPWNHEYFMIFYIFIVSPWNHTLACASFVFLAALASLYLPC